MVDISIIVPVYNHERYIKKAIDSILMQKGNYSYEVLIGEDCSQDNTRAVLKEIEPNLPSNFTVLYRGNNMGRFGKNNIQDLRQRAQGRYIIALEGDDFWTYDNKLQRQFEFLESNADYIAVAHNTEVVDENNNIINEYYPECKKREYTIDDFKKGLVPGQTTTILKRNYFKYNMFDISLEDNDYPGDRKSFFLMVANGKIACIQEKWSAYRHVTGHGTSFSARNKRSKNKNKEYSDTLSYYRSIYYYSIYHSVDESVKKVTEQLYVRFLLFYLLKGVEIISWRTVLKEIRSAQYITSDMLYVLGEGMKKILHIFLSTK